MSCRPCKKQKIEDSCQSIDDLLEPLAIADTIHDMVHPVKNAKHRCIIDNVNEDDIYNLKFVKGVFGIKDTISTTKTNIEEILLLCKLQEITTYTQLNKELKSNKVKDFEDLIIKKFNNTFENLRDNEEIIDLIKTKDQNKYLNKEHFLIDYLPPGYSKDDFNFVNSIATYWDPSITYNGTFDKNTSTESKEIINCSDVKQFGDTIELHYNDEKKVIFNKNILKSGRIFKNSVSSICDFIKKVNTNTNTITSIEDVIKHFFTGVDVNKLKKIMNLEHNPIYKVASSFAQFLLNINNVNSISEKLFDIKRSGDYGQINFIKNNNTTDNNYTLVTGDRLCYLRAKIEGINCVLLKPNNPGMCLKYNCDIASDDSKKINKIKNILQLFIQNIKSEPFNGLKEVIESRN